MSNGLGCFKHLGLCWCSVVAALASVICLADFGGTDSAHLATLTQSAVNMELDVDACSYYLQDISGDTAFLHHLSDIDDNLEVIKGHLYYIRYTGLRSITNGIWSIFEKLNTDMQHHLSGPDTHTSYESIYVHDVRNDDIYSRLGDLQDSINNLTNFLCYSPSFVTSINTNLPFLLMSLNFYQGDTQLQNAIRGIYQLLYGRSPSSDELNSLLSLTKNNNITRNFGALLLRDLPYSSLSSLDKQKYQYLMQYYGWQGSNPQTVLRNAGDIRYAYYGTRKLTDVSIGVSNLVASLYGDFSNMLVSVQGHYSGAAELNSSLRTPIVYGSDGKVSADRGVVGAVTNLADDFSFCLPSLGSDSIATVDTNDISQVEDGGYKGKLNEISNDSILNDTIASSLSDAVGNINQQAISFFPVITDQDSYTMSFGTFSLNGVSKNITFTFQRFPATYWTVQSFLFACLKVFALLASVASIYNHVAVESSM